MKLGTKKKLAAKTLKVGLARVEFNNERLDEIKEAITRQDIKDLKQSGAISIKEKQGKKKIVKRKTRRRAGKIKVKVKTRKQDYVKVTRKLRKYTAELKKQGKLDSEKHKEIRKQIKNRVYKSKRNLRESLEK